MDEIDTIRQELFAPIRTLRLFAIEGVLHSTPSSEILKILKERLIVEDDAECQLLLKHAIDKHSEKRETDNSAPDFLGMLSKYLGREPSNQLEVIDFLSEKDLKSDENKFTLDLLFSNSSHDIVTAQIIKKFYRNFNEERKKYLQSNLFHDSISLRIASLEALVSLSPSMLKDSFEKLVLSKEPIIRALAIRGLAKSSPVFAAEFLAEFLAKSDLYGQLAAVRVCSVIDFKLVKNSLLKILVTASDKRLLKMTGSIILANPDKEIPLRLYDLLDKVSEKKRAFVNNLINQYVKLLKASGVCKDFNDYFSKLKAYIAERKKIRASLTQEVEIYKENIEKSVEKKPGETVTLLPEKKHEKVFNVKLPEDNSESIKAEVKVTESIQSETIAKKSKDTSDSEASFVSQNVFSGLFGLSEEEQSQRLSVALKDSKPEMQKYIFRFAIDNNIDGLSGDATKFIECKNDELVAVAFEYLYCFNKDTFLLKMRKFATSDSILVRTVLISKACKDFPLEAKSLLDSMLRSSNYATRKKALGAVIHFEFSFIMPSLLDFVKRETETDLLISGLALFQANPQVESVYLLSKAKDRSSSKEIFEKSIEGLKRSIVFLEIATEEEIDSYMQSCKEKEKQLEDEKKQKEYYDSIKKKIDWSSVSELGENLQFKKILLSFVFLALVFVVLFAFSGDDVSLSATNKVAYRPIVAIEKTFEVIVKQINPDKSILVTDKTGRVIMLFPNPGKEFSVFPGDQLLLRGIPYKISDNGVLIVKTIKLSRM